VNATTTNATTTNSFYVGSPASPFFTVLANGNVGVGTAAPATKLEIYNSTGQVDPSLSAKNGTVHIGTNGGYALEIGQLLSASYGMWLQSIANAPNGIAYPLVLNPIGGSVGIGKTIPEAKLHIASIQSSNPDNLIIEGYTADGAVRTNTSYIRQRFDTNADYGSYWKSVRGANGATYEGVLGIEAAGADADSLYWRGDGNVGIGSAPVDSEKLHVAGGATTGVHGVTTATTNAGAGVIADSGNCETILAWGNSGGSNWTNCGTGGFTSDVRLKKDIKPIESGLKTILALRPVTYLWNKDSRNIPLITDSEKTAVNYGFIAQDVIQVLPDLVGEGPSLSVDGMPLQGGTNYYYLNYLGILPPLVNAVQELATTTTIIENNLALLTATSSTIAFDLESLSSTTPQSSDSFAGRFFSNLFARISAWLADAANGIANVYAAVIHSDAVHTKEICIQKSDGTEFCADGDTLQAMVAGSSGTSSGTGSEETPPSGGVTSSDTTPDPVPDPAPDPAPDTEAPVISIIGDNPVSVTVGSVYSDAGATVTDNVDTGLGAVVTGNDIDTSVVGSHEVKYNVTDAAGNIAVEMTRVVNVVE